MLGFFFQEQKTMINEMLSDSFACLVRRTEIAHFGNANNYSLFVLLLNRFLKSEN
jgi:hypothetical protein